MMLRLLRAAPLALTCLVGLVPAGCGEPGARSATAGGLFEGDVAYKNLDGDVAQCVTTRHRFLCRSSLRGVPFVVAMDADSRRSCARVGRDRPIVQSLDDPNMVSPALRARLASARWERLAGERVILGRRCELWTVRIPNADPADSMVACVDRTFALWIGMGGNAPPQLIPDPPGAILEEDLRSTTPGMLRVYFVVTSLRPRAVGDDEFAECPTR